MDNFYLVRYTDDEKKKHLTYVKGFLNVKFFMNRFEQVKFEKIEQKTVPKEISFDGRIYDYKS